MSSLQDLLKERRQLQSRSDTEVLSDISEDEDENKSLSDLLKERRKSRLQQTEVVDDVQTVSDETPSLQELLKQKRQGQLVSPVVQEDASVETPAQEETVQPEETPEQVFLRTGEVPEGFKYVPSVPTGDAPEDRVKLEPIDDAPTPTVSDQTDAVFGFEDTAKAFDAPRPDIDLGVDEFVDEKVAEPFKPVVRWFGKAAEKDLSNLAKAFDVAFEGAVETTENIGSALTVALNTVDPSILGMDAKTGGRKFARDVGNFLMMLEGQTGIFPSKALAPVRKVIREAKAREKLKKKGEKARQELLGRKMNISRAKDATTEEVNAKVAFAEKVAAENRDLKNELIRGFEESTGKTISKEVDGNLVIDGAKARKAGVETAREIQFKDRKTDRFDLVSSGKDVEVADDDVSQLLFQLRGEDNIVAPIVKPEKLDGLVAAASELKKNYKSAFDNDKSVIDNLLELTVDKEWGLAGDELIDTLNKYNVSFEDYILTVVGSGSEAGRVLNKLSQIKRSRPVNEMLDLQRAATQDRQGTIRNNIMRIEGIRRGGLVSQLATAARNLESAVIRSPMEGLTNMMDTALYNAGEAEGILRKTGVFTKSLLLDKENFKGSFASMRYMFGPQARLDTKDFVEFILDRPELKRQYDLMFNQLNELQAATGRGMARQKQVDTIFESLRKDRRFFSKNRKGKMVFNGKKAKAEAERLADEGILGGKFSSVGRGVDTVLSELEDGVSVLNSANRWQEYLIRRGSFLGELERLVKREYKIDLIDTLNDGKIKDLLNDATTVRPKGARSFNDLVADATNHALDVTYAKQPDIEVFREATSFITRNGLTVALPFPRWMFNSMELMGNYAGGASIPLTKKIMGQMPKGTKLSAKDRKRISRNLVGIAAVGAAYWARSDEDADADYKLLNVGDGTVLDTTPQFPLRQMLYLGEATKRIMDQTFDDFFDAREFSETFLGTNIRTGVGNSIIDEVVQLAGTSDLTKSESVARSTGRALGNYLSTWMVPFAQIIDTERALGIRTKVDKDTGKDPTLEFGKTFKENIERPSLRVTMSPQEEAALPKRERLFQEESRKVAPEAKVGLGLSLKTADSEAGQYIKRLGITEFELGSSSKVPSIRRFENKHLRDIIPGIVDQARAYEQASREQYRESEVLQETNFLGIKKVTEQEFVNSRTIPFITEQVKQAKRNLTGKDGKAISADAPAYIEAMLKYRRLPPAIRKNAATEFLKTYERPADGASMEDLTALGIIGKGLRDAYRGK